MCLRQVFRAAFLLLIPLIFVVESSAQPIPHPSTASYVLAPAALYQREEFTELTKSVVAAGGRMFRHPITNEVHAIQFYYHLKNIGSQKYQIVDLNLDTGTMRVTDGSFGRPNIGSFVVYPLTGKVYVASSYPAFLTEYDSVTGQAKVIRRLADTVALQIAVGDDLALYLGENIRGYVERYDPRLDPTGAGVAASWKNFGIIADPGPRYYRYVYSLGSDGKYIYAAVRDQNHAPLWRFVVKNIESGEEKIFGTEVNASFMSAASSRRGYGLGCYTVSATTSCFKFEGFAPPVPVSKARLPGDPIRLPLPEMNPEGYALALSRNTPDSTNGGRGTFRYKRPNDTAYTSIQTPVLRIFPDILSGIFDCGFGKLVGITAAYGPAFSFNPTNGKATILGRPEFSFYGALFSEFHNRLYLHGYPSAWQEYKPHNAWTLLNEQSYEPNINPHFLSRPDDALLMAAKYYYFSAEDANHHIWVAGHHQRDSKGSSVMWFDPMSQGSNKPDIEWRVPLITEDHGVLRTPFQTLEIQGLTSALGGRKMLMSARSGQDQGKIFVIDVSTKTVEREISIPSFKNEGMMTETAPGIIVGYFNGFLHKINIATGKILKSTTTPLRLFAGLPFYQARFTFGPDGYLWLYSDGRTISRVHPDTLESQKIIEDYAPAGTLTFANNDLLISGGRQTTVRKVSNLFMRRNFDSVAPAAPEELKSSLNS